MSSRRGELNVVTETTAWISPESNAIETKARLSVKRWRPEGAESRSRRYASWLPCTICFLLHDGWGPPLRSTMNPEATTVLFVDDSPASRLWFERSMGDFFKVVTARCPAEALELLAQRPDDFAVLVTDHRMPESDGMKLLRAVKAQYRHLIRLLATAYIGLDLAVEAVNEGKVMRILEKPLDIETTRAALTEALTEYRHQALERVSRSRHLAALRETLGFVAHELNTPLATVRNSLSGLEARRLPDDRPGVASFEERTPGEISSLMHKLERRVEYCQTLISSFVKSARDAAPGATAPKMQAGALVKSLLQDFPFDDDERDWVKYVIEQDFELEGRRDLIYLVLCTITKNALLAMRDRPSPTLEIRVGGSSDGLGWPGFIRFTDNGCGIPPHVLEKLTHEPITTRGDDGTGMGVMFAHRVMESVGGGMTIESRDGVGTEVALLFHRAVKVS